MRSWLTLRSTVIRAPANLRLPRRAVPFFALYGLVAAGNYGGYFLALERVPVAVAIVLLYTYPALTALAARFLYREPLTPAKIAAVMLTFAGVVLMSFGGGGGLGAVDPIGVGLALLAGGSMAAYGLMGKRATAAFSPWTITCYAFAFAGVWLGLAALGTMGMDARRETLAYTPTMWAAIAYLGLIPSLLGYGLFLWSATRIELSRASLWTMLEPPVAALVAYLALGERLQAPQLVGGALILTGVGLLQAGSRPAATGLPAPSRTRAEGQTR